jgi:hypothetical protein
VIFVDEANERYDLDDAGRLALDVALGTAGAIGDEQCGTEYILFGVIATAAGDMAELASLFALDSLRIERAINKLYQHRYSLSHDGPGDPPFSARAAHAVRTQRADGSGPTGPFELLHGALGDNASGASQVLRELGVRPDEVRRLVGYGIRHLSPSEIEALIASLNRRAAAHRPWWGPDPRAEVDFVRVAETKRIILAHSPSALAAIDGVRVARYGFGFTLVLESLKPWMLDPVLSPSEVLVPGKGAGRQIGPDMVQVEVGFANGASASNRVGRPRWEIEKPATPVLVHLGNRVEATEVNDRRVDDHRMVVSDWWVWPLPVQGDVDVNVTWASESIEGSATFDSRPVVSRAAAFGV